MNVEEEWLSLVEDMVGIPDVSATKMFGSPSLRTGRKMFAIFWREQLIIKLPDERKADVLDTGGRPFEPMEGRKMGDWVIAGPEHDWFELARESKEYVEALERG